MGSSTVRWRRPAAAAGPSACFGSTGPSLSDTRSRRSSTYTRSRDPWGPGGSQATDHYGPGNGKRTPHIWVDCGPDLLLIEVTSGRFTLPTLIEGDPDKAAADLTRLLFKKLDQLGRRIDDLLAGESAPPDVELERVERIWPVVVTADMLQNDLLCQEIKSRLPEALRRAGAAAHAPRPS
jgi:hypothetical protein